MSDSFVHFDEYYLTKSDLGSMGDDEIAVFGMLSYICNELNVFARFLRLSLPEKEVAGPVKFASDLQFHVVLRTLTARAFEAHGFLKEVVKNAQFTESEMILCIQRKAKEIEDLDDAEGCGINRNFRNETSFHYYFRLAKKNAKSLPGDTDASMYVNELDANSYSALGENLVFFERLRRFSDADKKYSDFEVLVESWITWSSKVVMIIKELQAELFGIVLERTGVEPRRATYSVKPEDFAEKNSAAMPIFIKEKA